MGKGRGVGREGGRRTTMTQEVAERLTDLIAAGCTVTDACLDAGVEERTYYNWRVQGRDLKAQADANPDALMDEEAAMLISFFQGTTRAQASARIAAVSAIRLALSGQEEVTESTKTTMVTRLRVVQRSYLNAAGQMVTEREEIPYEHRTVEKGRSVKQLAPNAAIGLEFLSRRDHEHWGKRQTIEIDWREQAIADIRQGKLDFELLAGWLGSPDEAAQLFLDAGEDVPAYRVVGLDGED